MSNVNLSELTDSEIMDQLEWLFSAIERFTEKLSSLKDFKIKTNDKLGMIRYLRRIEPQNLQDFLSASDLKTKQTATLNLVDAGVIYTEESRFYRQQKAELMRKKFVEECRINNVPLPETLAGQAAKIHLLPSDCPALHHWPDRRQPANGVAGRLENAGQFIQRLFKEKSYDQAVYGELYMSDLKHINPSLYQALAKWQSRTGEKLLKTKREQIDNLLALENSDIPLTFQQATQVRNARWRRKQQATTSP